jgi:hypothetical protein
MTATTQIRNKYSDGRACFDRQRARARPPGSAQVHKRRISDAIHARPQATLGERPDAAWSVAH